MRQELLFGLLTAMDRRMPIVEEAENESQSLPLNLPDEPSHREESKVQPKTKVSKKALSPDFRKDYKPTSGLNDVASNKPQPSI